MGGIEAINLSVMIFFLSVSLRSGVKDVPQNAKMHYNWANVLSDNGDPGNAIHHYETALRYIFFIKLFIYFTLNKSI